jgi:hypothetical protein
MVVDVRCQTATFYHETMLEFFQKEVDCTDLHSVEQAWLKTQSVVSLNTIFRYHSLLDQFPNTDVCFICMVLLGMCSPHSIAILNHLISYKVSIYQNINSF